MASIIHQPPTSSSSAPAAGYSSTFHQSILSPHPSFLPYPAKPPSLPLSSIPSLSLSKIHFSLPKTKPRLKPLLVSVTTTSAAQSHTIPPPLFPQSDAPSSNNTPASNYLDLLRISVRHRDVELAKVVHSVALKLEEENIKLSNALISAYLKLGLINPAYRVFLSLSRPDVVSYTTLISGKAKLDCELEAVDLFFEMRGVGIEPNEFSFVAILTACIRLSDLELGYQVHSLAIKMGYVEFTFVSNALMGLHVKCGRLGYVDKVFEKMPERDIASWNTVIAGVVKESMYDRAVELFRDMGRIDGFRVDQITLSTLVVACAAGLKWMGGREIHGHALRMGFCSSLSVNSVLFGFYAKCGSVRDVATLFETMPVKDVITWTEMITAYMDFGHVDLAVETFDRMPEKNCVSYNAMLSGYCRNGKGSRALSLFCKMVEEGIELDDFTLTSVINACGLLTDVDISKRIHGFVLKFGFGLNECIESALLDMCTRCGRMADAEKMFYEGPGNQNCSINWTSMMCGYSRNGQPEEAISLFFQRQSENMVVNEVALATVLGVCGTLCFQVIGKQVHCLALKTGLLSDIGMGNALISMYSKCGNMKDAIEVFSMMSRHDIVSWNSLMNGHLLHWQGDEALDLWSKMEKAGLQPDEVTFLLVISAYRHTNSNLVDDCRRLFSSMETLYHVKPNSEHYAAFIGVLGYWDLLDEAEEVINQMPFKPEASVWRALLDTSRVHLNPRLGKMAAKQILAVEPKDPSTYILASNVYSASGMWQCSDTMREEMRKKGFRKLPSRSWIIHQNKVHSFYARDKSHCQSKDIYSALDILIMECLKAGYVPDTSFVLQEVEEHQKTHFLFYHSAKLAATYGLLTARPGKPIRVTKNVLLCGDCHTFLKDVSVVTGREIHLRDTWGFHCFSNGQCSCKDYW